MPHNHDFLKHQIAIHHRCLERFLDEPSTVGHGCQVEDGQLVYKWIENSPAPQSVLKSINCKLKKNGCKDTCSCLKGGTTVYWVLSVLIGHLMKWLAVEVAKS